MLSNCPKNVDCRICDYRRGRKKDTLGKRGRGCHSADPVINTQNSFEWPSRQIFSVYVCLWQRQWGGSTTGCATSNRYRYRKTERNWRRLWWKFTRNMSFSRAAKNLSRYAGLQLNKRRQWQVGSQSQGFIRGLGLQSKKYNAIEKNKYLSTSGGDFAAFLSHEKISSFSPHPEL